MQLPSVTLQTVGPTLQAFGTEEQKRQWLPKLTDASGLAAANRLSAAQLVGVVTGLSADPARTIVLDALPRPGEDSTLGERFPSPPARGAVAAETGNTYVGVLAAAVAGGRELPRSVEQMTELVGRVSMKNLVRESTDLIERLCIEAALRITQDNRASAAEMLGLSRQGLYAKMRRYGIGDLDAPDGVADSV